jgi:hypothetical protein
MCGLLVVADYYFFEAIGGSDKRITGKTFLIEFPVLKKNNM